MCANQRCIPYWWKCDSADDCGDNSDEIGCGNAVITTTQQALTTPNYAICQLNQFQCRSGICIPLSDACDGARDCPEGEDEEEKTNETWKEEKEAEKVNVEANVDVSANTNANVYFIFSPFGFIKQQSRLVACYVYL